MPVFTFSGKDASGQKVSGERVRTKQSRRWGSIAARAHRTPGAIREKGKEFSMPTFGSGKVKTKDIAIFFRQFSVMIDAGLPLVQCLEILAANQESQSFPEDADRRPHHGGRRRDPGQRHAAVSTRCSMTSPPT
jgi:type IV pilus assembly protein PilC